MRSIRSLRASVLLALVPAFSLAQGFALDGDWVASDAVSSGVSSDNGWNAAELIEAKAVAILGTKLRLPDGDECIIGPPVVTVLRDDMYSWGSFGGSWFDLGLNATNKVYQVEVYDLACSLEGPVQLIAQTAGETLLLDVGGHVYVPLIRKPAS